jgi:hypothetical protein
MEAIGLEYKKGNNEVLVHEWDGVVTEYCILW